MTASDPDILTIAAGEIEDLFSRHLATLGETGASLLWAQAIGYAVGNGSTTERLFQDGLYAVLSVVRDEACNVFTLRNTPAGHA